MAAQPSPFAQASGGLKVRLAVTAGVASRMKTVFIEGDGAVLMERLTRTMDK